ncbi:MAG: hypothetical protein MPK06_04645 [Alphaproteobacteria bacterium]|nr:hypothetical protein [Alphaproteobacteria bacterium]MDA7983267.1 hypothetical protein [Alphaproteobacteria bacterium]MDA7984495.1 hypothetical protein [Alphaproteobacteria bacterium]MDA7987216.1 hypothetical protein [Alphaproteobacteria bacterium]MDA8000470.1 hypothetical protein [Alphaproteobacteria bacterium]
MTESVLPVMTDLGARIAAADGLEERDRLFALLRARRDEVKRSLADGLAPDAHERAVLEAGALDAAERIVASISFFHHRKI